MTTERELRRFGRLADGAAPWLPAARGLPPVRRPLDPFALREMPMDGCRVSEESLRLALRMGSSVDESEVNEDLLNALAIAPVAHLRLFSHAGGRILFGRTFVAVATSDEANRMRGRPISDRDLATFIEYDAAGANVLGLYDGGTNALLFTATAQAADAERIILHELGHALTVALAERRAHLRSDLLRQLPSELLTFLRPYAQGNGRMEVAERVLEVLAEAYVWLVVGRGEELSPDLLSALMEMLDGDELPLEPVRSPRHPLDRVDRRSSGRPMQALRARSTPVVA